MLDNTRHPTKTFNPKTEEKTAASEQGRADERRISMHQPALAWPARSRAAPHDPHKGNSFRAAE